MTRLAAVPTPLEDPEHPAWPFIRALRAQRTKAGMTQRELGASAGVTQSSIAQYERGANLPDKETAIKMEHALGIRSGHLTRLLGFLPADATRVGRPDVIDSISRDPLLSGHDRNLLLTLYSAMVAADAQRKAAAAKN